MAKQRSRENVRLATKSSDAELWALSYFDLAVAEGFVGNLDECERALDEFFRGAPVRDHLTGFSTSALGHAWRGWVLQYGGHMKDAAESFARAQQLAASADPLTQVLVAGTVFVFGTACGELPGAIELAARMAKVAEEFGAANLRVSALSGLAHAHAVRGDWWEAARLFEEGLALAHEHRVYLENEGHELASLAHAYVEIGETDRAKETAERAIVLVREQGSKLYELENVVALARAEVTLGHDDAVDPLLARAEALISAMGALAFRPHLAEIRAERARQRGYHAEWRAELREALRLFTETGATGHAGRVARMLPEPTT